MRVESATGTRTADESDNPWRYGLIAVALGLVALALCFCVAVTHYDKGGDAGTALAAVSGTIGAIVGAFFGIHVGSSGKAQAEAHAQDARDKLCREKDKSQALIDALPQGAAAPILDAYRR